jgi:hypothetical protein
MTYPRKESPPSLSTIDPARRQSRPLFKQPNNTPDKPVNNTTSRLQRPCRGGGIYTVKQAVLQQKD